MQTVLGEISYHHNSDKGSYREILDIPDGADPLLHVLVRALNNEHGVGEDRDLPAIAAAFEQAKATGQKVAFRVHAEYLGDDEEPETDDLELYTLWYETPERGTIPNVGFGPGEATDKYENVWIEAKQYIPSDKIHADLQKMSREELEALLLRVHAISGLLPIPGS